MDRTRVEFTILWFYFIPNMTTSNQHALGIDLGTSYSLIAEYRAGIIANDMGERRTPSTVSFSDNNERFIGTAAKNMTSRNVKNTVRNSKRIIGKNFDDPIVQKIIKTSPVKIIKSSHNMPLYQVKHKYLKHSKDSEFHTFYPEEIIAMILSCIQSQSHIYLHHDNKDCVISVPTHFNYRQRKSVLDAAIIANLNVLQLTNSTTTVALRFAQENHANYIGNTMVIDFGAGSCNVSIISINKNVITILSNAANEYLGSEDIDTILTNYFARKFNAQNRKLKVDVTKSHRAMSRLRNQCERAKRTLNHISRANIEIDSLCNGLDFSSSITRARFVDLCINIFDSCGKCMELALANASISKSQIDDVLVVGGCCRSYLLHKKVTEFFEGTKIRDINRTMNCDETVGFGTAIQTAVLMNMTPIQWQINDITHVSVYVDNVEIISEKSKIPCTVVKQFQTTKNNQKHFAPFKVFMGGNISDNMNLFGEFQVVQIPCMRQGFIVDVVFHVDAGGLLSINVNCDIHWCMILVAGFIRNVNSLTKFIPESIKDIIIHFGEFNEMLCDNPLRTKIECQKNGLNEKQIKEKRIKFMEYEKVENDMRSRIEARNQLENYVYQMRNAIDDSRIQDAMSDENKKIVLDVGNDVLDWIDCNQHVEKEVYERKQNELEIIWKPIIDIIEECYRHVSPVQMPGGMPNMGCTSFCNRHQDDCVSGPIIDDVD
eukprot:252126_1